MKKIAISALLLGLCQVSVAQAESLQEAIATAYRENPTLLAAREGLKVTDESVALAVSDFRPTVAGSGSVEDMHSKTTQNGAKTDNDLTPMSATLSLNQSLFSGFSGYHGVQASVNRVRAGQARLMSTEQDIFLSVAESYLTVVRDESVLNLRTKNEQVLARQLEAAEERFEVGEVTKTDVSQALARVSGAKAARIQAEGALKASRAAYRKIVGHYPEAVSFPTLGQSHIPDSLEDAVETARKKNPLIHAAQYDIRAAEKDTESTEGGLLPSLDFSASVGRYWDQQTEDTTTDTVKAGFTLTVPLYPAGAVRSQIRAGKYAASQARQALDGTYRSVEEQVIAAWENLQATEAAIEARDKQVEASRLALEGVTRESQVGSRTVLDVLDAEEELLDAEVERVSAERDRLSASFRILASVGSLTAQALNLSDPSWNMDAHYQKTRSRWLGTGTN